jgi:hypothetical protein
MALSDDLRQILVRAVTAESRAIRPPAPGDLAHHRARQKPSAALVGEGVLDFASITSEAMVVSHGYHVSVKVDKPPDIADSPRSPTVDADLSSVLLDHALHIGIG